MNLIQPLNDKANTQAREKRPRNSCVSTAQQLSNVQWHDDDDTCALAWLAQDETGTSSSRLRLMDSRPRTKVKRASSILGANHPEVMRWSHSWLLSQQLERQRPWAQSFPRRFTAQSTSNPPSVYTKKSEMVRRGS